MNRWNPHKLKDESGNLLNYTPSWTNWQIALYSEILKKTEKSEDSFSIIIQGPINKRSINTIPDYLKYGKVIVSHWEGDDESLLKPYLGEIEVAKSDYKEVKNFFKQPGKQAPWVYQHQTTLKGLELSESYFSIKLRSDESFPDLDALVKKLRQNRDQKDEFTKKYNWFKIVTSNIYFRFDHENKFHPSDHIVAGATSRMKESFSRAKYLCKRKPEARFPEQLLCKAIMETMRDKLIPEDSESLMKKHFDVIRIKDLKRHIWTSSYRKYDPLISEENWCNDINNVKIK